jgi:hypothetical protein
MISKIISSKISINKQNYKNNYLYLTLGWKGLGIKLQDKPQGSQYHAVVHQCVLYHGNLNIKLGIVLKTCTITQNTDYN